MTDNNSMEKIEGQEVKILNFNAAKDLKPIVKNDIPELQPKIAFLLENVLSPSECKSVIKQGEEFGFDNLMLYNKKYRDNQRILVKSFSLAEVVFERIKPYLLDQFEINKDKSKSTAPLDSAYLGAPRGRWDLLGLNELWRLCKYNPGGKFLAHYDGLYEKDKYTRSFLTFMIYLNGDVDGGNTRFLNAKLSAKDEGYVVARVVPKVGSVLVFQHDLFHDGDTVQSGLKYIIRSDVMYSLYNPTPENPEKIKIERMARLILAQAIEMEKINPAESIALYKRAFKMCPELESTV
eukprot:gene4710-5882_t